MAFINHSTKNIAVKVVYYGAGLSGKTTNLRYIYSKMDPKSRGDLICLETATERTFFFDLLPIKAGKIRDYQVHFQLFTVPGQVFYEASRRSMLKKADGIVFVADSQVPLLDANLESFDGLRKTLLQYDVDINFFPLVFQYNKRDLENLIPIETFNNLLNPKRLPFIEAAAVNGVGVIETLKEIAKLIVPEIQEKYFDSKAEKDQKVREKPQVEFSRKEPSPKKEEIEFISESKPSSIKFTKVKLKSWKDITKEIDHLSETYTSKK
jgi:signal recognition particle receptor subunit beta